MPRDRSDMKDATRVRAEDAEDTTDASASVFYLPPGTFEDAYADEIMNLYITLLEQCKQYGYPLLKHADFPTFAEFVKKASGVADEKERFRRYH